MSFSFLISMQILAYSTLYSGGIAQSIVHTSDVLVLPNVRSQIKLCQFKPIPRIALPSLSALSE